MEDQDLVQFGVEGRRGYGRDLANTVYQQRPYKVGVGSPGCQAGAPATAVGPGELEQHSCGEYQDR